MKPLILALALIVPAAAFVQSEKPLPKINVAIVRMNRLMNNNVISYDMIRLLSADKESLATLKKIAAEIRNVQQQIVDAGSDEALNELGRKLEFLNRKNNLLRQHIQRGGGDVNKTLREFVVTHFKSQYHLIAQEPDAFDRFLSKENVEVRDITDDVAAKIKEYVAANIGL